MASVSKEEQWSSYVDTLSKEMGDLGLEFHPFKVLFQ